MGGNCGRMGAVVLYLLFLIQGYVTADEPREPFWIFLTDKANGQNARVIWQGSSFLHNDDELDLPIDPVYIARIEAAGLKLRTHSRWLNAISVKATSQERDWLAEQTFVRDIRPVMKFRRTPVPVPVPDAIVAQKATAQGDYGLAFEQLAQIKVIPLHNMGYKGEGVRIGLLDSGFHYPGHNAFGNMRLVAERDFINGDDVVSNQDGQVVTGNESTSDQNRHGTQSLSLLAGYDPGRFIGAAPNAEYILAKIEDISQEMQIEEDRWVAGLEWVVEMGAQVVNSSLGYTVWDDGSGYTFADLDGKTAPASQAAALAVRRGVVVVVAAGNEGDKDWRYITVPADVDGVISVGAVGRAPQGANALPEIAAFSSRGPTADGRIKPDVVAPGGFVRVVSSAGDYVNGRGTSLAAPLISGACALLLQIHPQWGPAEILAALKETTVDLGDAGPDTTYGWGLVDALAASGQAVETPEQTVVGAPFPNPARTEVVHFSLDLVGQEAVALKVFDLAGNLVDEILERRFAAGSGQELQWEFAQRKNLANGLYFYHLQVGTKSHMGKIALVR